MKKKALLLISASGLFLFIDQFLKWQSLYHWRRPRLITNLFGWEPFLNQGVAFGLPVPNWLIISLTLLIIITLIYLVAVNMSYLSSSQPPFSKVGGYNFHTTGLMLVLMGGLSNLIDRLIYHATIDYLRVFTGVINAADILIVAGFVACLLKNAKLKTL